MKIRFLSGAEARDYDAAGNNYELKAGSVIEIPDAVVVRNGDGEVDLVATMENWVENPDLFGEYGVAGRYALRNEGKAASAEKMGFGAVTVVKAASGSSLPPQAGKVNVAVEFMAKQGKIKLNTSPTPVAPSTEIAPSGKGRVVSPGDPDYVFPAPRLNRDGDAAQIAAIIDAANGGARDAGTQAAACPEGTNCEAVAGKDDGVSVACEYVFRNGYPNNLANTFVADHDKYELVNAWFQTHMAAPSRCLDSCSTNDTNQKSNLQEACSTLKDCNSRCSTSALDKMACGRTGNRQETACQNDCSPFRGLKYAQRSREVREMYAQAHASLVANNPRLGQKVELSGKGSRQAMRMACLNKVRENPDLEPLIANCESSAIGFGQVLKDTFYETLGLSRRNRDTCADMKLKDLASKCPRYLAQAARLDVYGGKYDELTPRQLYEFRVYNVEFQVRSSYAAWVNKLMYSEYDSDKALRAWFGISDSAKRNAINSCTENGAG